MNDLLNQLHNQVLVDYIQDDTQSAEVIPAEVEESATALAKQQAMQELVEKRKKEIEEWALRRGIQKGVPDQEDIEKISRRLRKGKSITDSIKGVCSHSTWRRWKEQYPALEEMEEDAREWRKNRLSIEAMRIADMPDREKMGQNTRDNMRINTRLAEIARIDKLTEIRNNKNQIPNNVIPIQINVKYGKDDKIV